MSSHEQQEHKSALHAVLGNPWTPEPLYGC